jgi:hypothetical protein
MPNWAKSLCTFLRPSSSSHSDFRSSLSTTIRSSSSRAWTWWAHGSSNSVLLLVQNGIRIETTKILNRPWSRPPTPASAIILKPPAPLQPPVSPWIHHLRVASVDRRAILTILMLRGRRAQCRQWPSKQYPIIRRLSTRRLIREATQSWQEPRPHQPTEEPMRSQMGSIMRRSQRWASTVVVDKRWKWKARGGVKRNWLWASIS